MNVTVHDRPPLGSANGNCYGCHGLHKGKYYATNMESAIVGDITLCTACVTQLAKLAGFIPADRLVALKDANLLLSRENERLKHRSDTLDDILKALAEVRIDEN